jgi:tRNA-specific 2-thiouridylase
VADVDDARRVAQQLGIDHVVFNFTEDFDTHVVDPYVDAHRIGLTPNPCVECNRHLKFDRLLARSEQLGFDGIATGHHCGIDRSGARPRVRRGADRPKDQSYVVHMLDARQLDRTWFPVGSMTKADVRVHAERLGLRTAGKPDSQDVCFITSESGRAGFLADRLSLRPGKVVDTSGHELGRVDAVELMTIGQRRGLDLGGAAERRYVVDVDPVTAVVTAGSMADLMVDRTPTAAMMRTGDDGASSSVLVQTSAHGTPRRATIEHDIICWAEPQRRVAPGQSLVFYDPTDTYVVGSATAI